MIRWQPLPSPIGELTLVGTPAGLTMVLFANSSDRDAIRARYPEGPLPQGADELEAYFAGILREFTVPLTPAGTPFQQRVWAALRAIPYGETTSYGRLAAALGNPQASRAVGLANGSNPIPIIVPCHRVIGANGKLTGFGGGLPAKAWLLGWERERNFFGPAAE